ncbi:DUF2459 domain-containing protein [Salisaeta longa]|uniref:DUF2459 domain-containing protein n=1 Tax=Salisaeta longa TaxID=503170 RepID=UPI0003B63973|nr:DUF2459 domain-containing protein [Salisaeta longa]
MKPLMLLFRERFFTVGTGGCSLLRRPWWALAVLLVGCGLPEPVRTERAPADTSRVTITLIRHGWHAGLAVPRAALDSVAWVQDVLGPTVQFVEMGWGEARYYPAPDPGWWATVRAGAWPTGSVVHLVPVTTALTARFPRQPMVRLRITEPSLAALLRYLRASVVVRSTGRAVGAAPGWYPTSQFVRSPLTYHLFQNCNHWVAEALEAAGCSTTRWRALTVGAVLRQARRCEAAMPSSRTAQ